MGNSGLRSVPSIFFVVVVRAVDNLSDVTCLILLLISNNEGNQTGEEVKKREVGQLGL